MRKIYLALLASAFTLNTLEISAASQGISFQAVVRDGNGQLMSDKPVGVRVCILRNGYEVVYEEERVLHTNSNGLMSFAIGDGTGKTRKNIDDVDWSSGSFSIRCEMDIRGGSCYSISQTTPLTSVPFALYAQKLAPGALPEWIGNKKPTYSYSEIEDAPKIPTKLSDLENDLFLQNTNFDVEGSHGNNSQNKNDFATSIAFGITANDTARWNKAIREPLFTASPASNITRNDVANWNAKAKKSDIPTKVSQLTNDSNFVSENKLENLLQTINNRLKDLEDKNKSLNRKSDSLQAVVAAISDKAILSSEIIYRQIDPTYPFKTDSWNKAEDIYQNMHEGDRVFFIVRHSERPSGTTVEVSLTENGKSYALNVGKKMTGGLAKTNDAIYGSTEYLRCRQTSAYIAEGRGDNKWSGIEMVEQPISVLNQFYIAGTTDWNTVASYYDKHRDDAEFKCKHVVETLCKMSEGKTFGWFTSHDALMVILARWASNGKITFQYGTDGWINFLSGIAVIVHENGAWETYPVRNLENGYMNW
ncbi:MAG: hypothetical protein MJZ23_10625 [Paludibacteraceae bacterium]|nr:hypothetical protein [Paludibacteraceae bacterium]